MAPDSSQGHSDDTTRGAADLPTREASPVRSLSGAADLSEGQLLGDYHLIRRLGRGGSGEVWEAESISTQRRLGLKVLTAARQSSPEMVARFEREGQLAASVNHARCVFVFGADDVEGCPIIAMELMRGGTLQDRLASRGPMAVTEGVDTILDVIEGLEAAHTAGILHRDIKPSNCFLDETGRAKIGDFGISKTLEAPSDLTLTGAFLGTPSYASPEQVRGRDVGLQSDIYSVGATLYALLTGAAPFQGDSAGAILARIVAEPPTPFSQHPARIPRELERVILRALSKHPRHRFQRYADLRAALLPFSSRGLTVGGLGKRFLAYQLDTLPFTVANMFLVARFPNLGLVPGNTPGDSLTVTFRTVPLTVALSFVPVLYFLILETRWNRTIAKYLLGLRVTTVDGSPPGPGQVFLRTLVFCAVVMGVPAVSAGFFPSPGGVLLGGYAFLIIFVTMRARNGYAGLHEVLSGTRVMDVRRQDAIALPEVRAPGSPLAPDSATRIGPYRVLETVWSGAADALRLAQDDVLDRTVWIHEHADNPAQPAAALVEVRPGRLHWLQGGRTGSRAWDAYDAPAGIDYHQWVRDHGRLSWAEVRSVLAGVLTELKALETSGLRSARFSLRHIWIDAYGHAKLLNFPISSSSDPTFSVSEWHAFSRAITVVGLCGASPQGLTDVAAMPRVPVPDFARPVIHHIVATDEATSLTAVIDELETTDSRAARVTRARRSTPLLIMAAPVLMVSMGFAFMTLLLPRMVSTGAMDLMLVRTYTRQFLQLSQAPDQAAVKRQQEAIQKVLAYSYRQAQADRQSQQVLASLSPIDRRFLEVSAARYPDVTAAEAAEARRLTSVFDSAAFPVRAIFGFLILVTGVGVVICQLLLTAILGAPPLFRLCGISVQRADGRRAGRLRCLWRAAIVASPAFLVVVTIALTIGLRPSVFLNVINPRSALPMSFVWAALVALAAAYVLAAVYAIARPTRGIPDLLAATYLVPR